MRCDTRCDPCTLAANANWRFNTLTASTNWRFGTLTANKLNTKYERHLRIRHQQRHDRNVLAHLTRAAQHTVPVTPAATKDARANSMDFQRRPSCVPSKLFCQAVARHEDAIALLQLRFEAPGGRARPMPRPYRFGRHSPPSLTHSKAALGAAVASSTYPPSTRTAARTVTQPGPRRFCLGKQFYLPYRKSVRRHK